MNLKNFLDLRKKDIQIIEKTVFIKRPWYSELSKTLLVILVASVAIWGISKADIILTVDEAPDTGEQFL